MCLSMATAVLLVLTPPAWAQDGARQAASPDPRPRLQFYGFIQMDGGYDFGRIDPKYYDRLRPSALPASPDEFGRNGSTYFSVRQTRLGAKGQLPTAQGPLSATVEFDLVGAGERAGQTTLRLRHAFGEFGAWGAGQYWSPFVDPDVSPEIFESFRPPGQPFTRSVQLRWTPLSGDTRLTLAIEKPGARADGGDYNDQIVERRLNSRFPVPELVASLWKGGRWGHVQVAGLWRHMRWNDLTGDQHDLTGSAAGYGVNLTSHLTLGRHVVRVQYAAGRGIENYLNDSTPDIAIRFDDGNSHTPLEGVALPVQAFTGYLESRLGSARMLVGYGRQAVANVEGQAEAAYHAGSYATATLVFSPGPGVNVAAEYQWGRRENAFDGWSFDDHRVQVSLRCRFSAAVGGS